MLPSLKPFSRRRTRPSPCPSAPGFVLELAYDGCGLFAATWRAGSWWRAAEIGEA
ncbi:hypothetical protein [Sorangium sp. So ce341]|uniref:hypothetical protein n=1 Tax=Sorangium sp. So ce341 TaxID=3133302 RepID=UPI003F6325D8